MGRIGQRRLVDVPGTIGVEARASRAVGYLLTMKHHPEWIRDAYSPAEEAEILNDLASAGCVMASKDKL